MTNENLNPETREPLGGYWTIAVFDVDSRSGSITKGNNGDAQHSSSVLSTGIPVTVSGKRGAGCTVLD